MLHANLIVQGKWVLPFMQTFTFLPLLIVMAIDLTNAIADGARATRQLRISEAEVRQRQHLIELATDTAGIGLWAWDPGRDEMWSNDRCRDILRASGASRIGLQDFLELLHPGDRARVRGTIEAALASGGKYACDYRTDPGLGGMRWVHALGSLEYGPTGQPLRLRGALVDITALQRAEEERERHRSEIAHLARVASLGELSSSLAHELSQPLTAILANAQAAKRFLSKDDPDLAKVAEIMNYIVQDDKRAAEVLHRVRTLVRKEPATNELIGANHVVSQSLQVLRGELSESGARVEVELAEDEPQILAGAVEVQQALINLIMNSLQAMAEVPVADRTLRLRTRAQGGWVVIEVADTGPGFASEVMPRLFQSFVTTKTAGMGIGLSICKRLAEAYGGQIRAGNWEGGGALVLLEFPLATRTIHE